MALRSGLNAQLGFISESTWATRVTPTRFLEFTSEGIDLSIERISSNAIRAGNRVARSDRWVADKQGAAGALSFEVASKGYALLLRHMLGTIAITTPGGGTLSRDHTATLGDLDNLGMTLQIGRPDSAGTVQPFEYAGSKVTEWEISNSVGGLLALSASIDAPDESTAQSLATASYPVAQELLSYVGGTITVAGASMDVADFSLKGSNGLKTDRRFLRNSVIKKEQHPTEMVGLSGSITPEFENLTAYNRFVNGTVVAITALWEASIIEAALRFSVLITLPACRFDGTTPKVSGTDILTQPLPFTVLNDGTNPPVSIRYRTTDLTS